MNSGIVRKELSLNIVTEVKSPKLKTKTAELIKINSFLILGISILIILTNGEILSKRHCLDSYK